MTILLTSFILGICVAALSISLINKTKATCGDNCGCKNKVDKRIVREIIRKYKYSNN